MNEDSLPPSSKEILDTIKQGEEPQNYKKILRNFESVKTCLEIIDWAEWSYGRVRWGPEAERREYDFRLTRKPYLVQADKRLHKEYEDEHRRLGRERDRSGLLRKRFIPKFRVPKDEIYRIVEDLRWDPYRIIFLSFTLDYLICCWNIGKKKTEPPYLDPSSERAQQERSCYRIQDKALNKLRYDYFMEVAQDNFKRLFGNPNDQSSDPHLEYLLRYRAHYIHNYDSEINKKLTLGCFMALFQLMRHRWVDIFKTWFKPRVITTMEINFWRSYLREYTKSLKFYLIMIENRVQVIRALMRLNACTFNTCLTPENVTPLKTAASSGYSVLENYWKNFVINSKWLIDKLAPMKF